MLFCGEGFVDRAGLAPDDDLSLVGDGVLVGVPLV